MVEAVATACWSATLALVLVSWSVQLAEADCVWYGECGVDPDRPGRTLNCAYNGSPVPLKNESIFRDLADVCPDMILVTEAAALCCDVNQVQSLINGFRILQSVVGKCPSCLYNFRKIFCHSTCNPDQSQFLEVVKTVNISSHEAIQEVNYYLDSNMMDEVYAACEHVSSPAVGGTVFGIMCGAYGRDLCTVDRLLQFLGDNKNGYAPLKFNFILSNASDDMQQSRRPLNWATSRCQTGPNIPVLGAQPLNWSALDYTYRQLDACSCADCEAACSIPDFESYSSSPFVDFITTHWTAYALTFIGCCAALFVFTSVSIYWTKVCLARTAHTDNDKEGEKECHNQAVKVRWWNYTWQPMPNSLRFAFRQLGLACAKHPWWTITSSISICLILSFGIYFSTVTTDPIKLWSSPDSRSVQEKIAFESAFAPFYRVEQIIITLNEKQANQTFQYRDILGEDREFSAILSKDFLLAVLQLEEAVMQLRAPNGTSLGDICHKPLEPDNTACNVQSVWSYWQNSADRLNATANNSAVDHMDSYLDHYILCVRNPTLDVAPTGMRQSCKSRGGIPVEPFHALGGYQNTTVGSLEAYSKPTAFIITFLVNNDAEMRQEALAWEHEFINFMHHWMSHDMPDFMDIAFNAERSFEDQIFESSLADAPIVVLSYVIMFLYVIISLGRADHNAKLANVKVTLAITGLSLVLGAILCAVGFFGYVGISTTLIVFQIMPFLVLAVGIDNIFIMVHTLQRNKLFQSIIKEGRQEKVTNCQQLASTVEDIMSDVLGQVGPSMLQSCTTQVITFSLGALSDMPAVKAFSLYAALALFFNFALQVTTYVAVLTLDLRRMLDNRLDVLCCLNRSERRKSYTMNSVSNGAYDSVDSASPSKSATKQAMESQANMENKCDMPLSSEPPSIRMTSVLWQKYYIPFLMNTWVRRSVIVIFTVWLILSLLILPLMPIGLEQEMAMPDGSQPNRYLQAIRQHLSVGPPLYMVVNDTSPSVRSLDFGNATIQQAVCAGSGCDDDSVLNQIHLWSLRPITTRIATAAQSWLDDYFDWATSCCLQDVNKGGEYCTPLDYGSDYYDDYQYYDQGGDSAPDCQPCSAYVAKGQNSSQFFKYMDKFLEENPSQSCPKGGKAQYGSALRRVVDGDYVVSSYYFTFHSVLRTSDDFTQALRWARMLADDICNMLRDKLGSSSISVYPYSVFYVFYEQYLEMTTKLSYSILFSIVAVGGAFLVLTGYNVTWTLIIVTMVCLTLVNLGGFMVSVGINLNAVSVVNLVMAVGIAVEFSCHLVQAYAETTTKVRTGSGDSSPNVSDPSLAATNNAISSSPSMCSDSRSSSTVGSLSWTASDVTAPSPIVHVEIPRSHRGCDMSLRATRVQRSARALGELGPVLLSGVHMTNLLGVAVLGLANSQLFHVFYFLMYIGLVIIGAVHGLVLLPVLLTYYGPD